MKHSHKLPTFKEAALNFAIFGVIVFVECWFFDLTITDLSNETKIRLSRLGILLVYASGLMAGYGFYWLSKARANKTVSEERICSYNNQLSLLNALEAELRNVGLNDQKNRIIDSLKKEQAVLLESQNYWMTVNKVGRCSIVVLMIGTAAQMIAVG